MAKRTLSPTPTPSETSRRREAGHRGSAAAKAFVPPELPPVPVRDLPARLRQRNLDDAVLLAQQAARHRGPLVEHFAELGRRYAELLDAPPRPNLRAITGGAA